MSPRSVIALLASAALVLLAVELALGARDYGEVDLGAPCEKHALFEPGGLDGTVQRIVLEGIDGAACRLGTTRERLLLSLSASSEGRFGSWSDDRLETAVRESLVAAVNQAERRGDLNGVEARLLREVAERAPLDLVVSLAGRVDDLSALADLFG
ncbi:MAG: hypothetical protein ACXWYS_04050 [Gaiellaceae bacterium]